MNYRNIIKIIPFNYTNLILTQVRHGENKKRLQHPGVVSKPRAKTQFFGENK
jgi:hypothetical protein